MPEAKPQARVHREAGPRPSAGLPLTAETWAAPWNFRGPTIASLLSAVETGQDLNLP